jgi:hypothetical protein
MPTSQEDILAANNLGLVVCSAFFFNNIVPGLPLPTPPCRITLVRVVDASMIDDSDMIYEALEHIKYYIKTGKYKFVTISIGPNLPIDDKRVNLWTATLDNLALKYDVFISVAAGNNGVGDYSNLSSTALAEARCQVPSDGVNLFTVGAYTVSKKEEEKDKEKAEEE